MLVRHPVLRHMTYKLNWYCLGYVGRLLVPLLGLWLMIVSVKIQEPPAVTVTAVANSAVNSARSHCALSRASCLAASSIENYFLASDLAIALTNRVCLSLVRFIPILDSVLGALLPPGLPDSSISTY